MPDLQSDQSVANTTSSQQHPHEEAMPATLAACPDILEQWIGACMFGTSVWSEAHDSVQSLDVTDYKKNYPLMNLSLVMTIQDDGDVVLDDFYWARTPAKWGWASRALQDRSNCIKFTPTCRTLGQPLIDLRSLPLSGKSKVLWADIGIRMDKLVRHKIPSNVMHFKKMYSAMSGIALEVRCFFCDANATAQSTLQTCPACMCTMHPQCARTSLPNAVQQGPLPRLACPYPSNWSLCPLCALASVSM